MYPNEVAVCQKYVELCSCDVSVLLSVHAPQTSAGTFTTFVIRNVEKLFQVFTVAAGIAQYSS